MQTVHDHATTLEMLSPGQAFRFHFRDEAAMGLKAQFTHGARGHAALVLTSTKTLRPGALLSGFDVGEVVELVSSKVTPSTAPGTVTPGKGYITQPGEIELHGSRLLFVTKPHGDDRITYRVDVQSGDIVRSSGTPLEIYSEWSIQNGTETLHEHKPTSPDPAAPVTVTIE
jgi:hypothetical protein